jgi:hypothetical protein
MPDDSSEVGVVDAVWSAASDGRWHTRHDLMQTVTFETVEVSAAIDLLVKYGFAERSVDVGEWRFRILRGCPSPLEAAEILLRTGLPLDPRLQSGGVASRALF